MEIFPDIQGMGVFVCIPLYVHSLYREYHFCGKKASKKKAYGKFTGILRKRTLNFRCLFYHML